MHNLIKFAQKLDYRILVTTKTIDEFHFSVNNKLRQQHKKSSIPRDLVRIAIDQLDDDSVLVNYWKDYVKSGLTIEDFIAEKSHVESILSELKIQIFDKYRKDIESSEDLKQEESILRTACGDRFDPNIVEHDAFHRVLINKLRKSPKYHFHNAVAWFLTHDNKLLQYSKVARKGNQSLPFCITSDQWIQINRPFLSRTVSEEEYEDSFYLLVTQPYLRSFTSTISLDECYERVLNQLARFNNMNPELAFQVVADRHFMVTLALEQNEQQIETKLNNKFVDLANELSSEKAKLSDEIQKATSSISKLEHENQQLLSQIGTIEQDKDSLKSEFNNLNRELGEEKKNREKADQKITSLERALKTTVRWSVFLFSLAILSFLIWGHPFFWKFVWLSTHKNSIIIKLLTQTLSIFGLLNIPLSKHWKVWLPLSIAVLIAIFTLSA